MRLLYTTLLILCLVLWTEAPSAQAIEITGVGATFPYPLYAKWAEAYEAKTGQTLSYNAIGSGCGIKHIKAGGATFGGSDMPLPANELNCQFLSAILRDITELIEGPPPPPGPGGPGLRGPPPCSALRISFSVASEAAFLASTCPIPGMSIITAAMSYFFLVKCAYKYTVYNSIYWR
jgi:hypothetical protein